MPSMPKVRASSGTIGTTRWPMALSLASVDSNRTKAMVVEMLRSPLPRVWALKASSPGTGSTCASLRRTGMRPPSSRRRSRM